LAKTQKPNRSGKFRIGQQLSGADLRQFRRDVAELNRKGLIPGKPIKASSARPFQVRGNSHLYELVRDYRSVLEGKAEAVRLPRAGVIEQHKLKRKTVHGTILIPKAEDEKVTILKSGAVRVSGRGWHRIDIPGKFLDKRFEKRLQEILKETKGQKYFGYEMADHKGHAYTQSLPKLIEYLRTYYKPRIGVRGMVNIPGRGEVGGLKSHEFYENIAILTSDDPDKLAKEGKLAGKLPEKRKRKTRKRKK
jgi:hypothetical protein